GGAGRESRLRRKQGGGLIARRIAARGVLQGTDQGDRPRTRLHRVRDDREVQVDDVDGGQRNRGARDGRCHRTRNRTGGGAVVAVGSAGAAAEGAAAADDQTVRLGRRV